LILRDIIIEEWRGWPAHIHADVNWVDLIEQSNIICQLLLHFELEVVHLEVVDRVLEFKQVLLQVGVISCLFKSIEQPEVVPVDEEAYFNKVRNRLYWVRMNQIVNFGKVLLAVSRTCIPAASFRFPRGIGSGFLFPLPL